MCCILELQSRAGNKTVLAVRYPGTLAGTRPRVLPCTLVFNMLSLTQHILFTEKSPPSARKPAITRRLAANVTVKQKSSVVSIKGTSRLYLDSREADLRSFGDEFHRDTTREARRRSLSVKIWSFCKRQLTCRFARGREFTRAFQSTNRAT